MNLEAIFSPQKLFGNPIEKLQYSRTVNLKDNTALSIADPKATRAMVALMDMQAVMGGAASHWGGPAAFAELLSSIHGYMFYKAKEQNKKWHELFHFVNDAGHCENGLYALKANYQMADLNLKKLKGFRSITSPLTGHGEAHLFPQGVYISNGPLGSGLPQAQGLAMADSLSKKQRITVCALSDGGAMEGEAREALASIPGLAKNRKLERFILVISDNNTKLSGRIDEDSFSMEPTFRSLDPLGWKMIELQEGNDLQKCLSAFEKAVQWVEENPHVPVVILAKTVKGFGVKSTMSSASGGHGFPVKKPQELSEFLKEIYIGENVPSEFMNWCEEMVLEYNDKNQSSNSNQTEKFPTEKVQVGITKALINMRKKGYPVISITSDLPDSTGVGGFRKEFKSEQIDVGIAESNMISVAIGLSKEGYIPVVDTFAQFGVTKGALPLIMSALSQGPVIAIFSHAGFQDAADGASHQALSYFAMTHSIPYTDTYMLSCSGEAEMLVTQAIEEFANAKKQGKVPHSKIFFLGRENFPRWMQTENENYKLGKSFLVFDNTSEFSKSIIIAATGPMVFNSLAAAKELGRQNVGCAIINPIAINRVDTELFESILPRVNGRLLTVEDHQVVGGMGAVLVHELSQKGLIKKVRSLGVKNHFGQSAYTADELYKMHGLDSASIFAAALDMMT